MTQQLILKRAALSRSSGQWSDDDYDVLENGVVVGRICKEQGAPPDLVDLGDKPLTLNNLDAMRGPNWRQRKSRGSRGVFFI
jgi:hypothetical protein